MAFLPGIVQDVCTLFARVGCGGAQIVKDTEESLHFCAIPLKSGDKSCFLDLSFKSFDN